MKKEDKMLKIPQEAILMNFKCEGNTIAVFDNAQLNGAVAEDDVIMAKVVVNGEKGTLEPLSREEYFKALEEYEKVLNKHTEGENG